MRRRRNSPLLRMLKAAGHAPCRDGVRRLLSCASDEEAIRKARYPWAPRHRVSFYLTDVKWTEFMLRSVGAPGCFRERVGPRLTDEDARAFVLKTLREYRHGEAVAACIARTQRRI